MLPTSDSQEMAALSKGEEVTLEVRSDNAATGASSGVPPPPTLSYSGALALMRIENEFGLTVDHDLNKLVLLNEHMQHFPQQDVSEPPFKLIELLREYVQSRLLESKELDLELKCIPLPQKSPDWYRATMVLMTRDALTNPERLLLVVPGMGRAGCGLWCPNECASISTTYSQDSVADEVNLDLGSFRPCVHIARLHKFGVIITNPNQSFRYRYSSPNSSTNGSNEGAEIEMVELDTPLHREEHLIAVGDALLTRAQARHWAVIGQSAAGKTVIDWMAKLSERAEKKENTGLQEDFLFKRLKAVALADSVSLLLSSKLSTTATDFWRGFNTDQSNNVAVWVESADLPLDAPMALGAAIGVGSTSRSKMTQSSVGGGVWTSARPELRSGGSFPHSRIILMALEPMLEWIACKIEDYEANVNSGKETVSSLANSSSSLQSSSSTCSLQ
eukprot:TRINITY_DN7005_c0_g1_i1.p1 TRINITY_DN7005_c0_g1~~TRINITY_DN7005_c0_g1_i1.p1  ORF type:complete len:446 (-),score=94.30 TRINITY_DN7005_c0_g1_i1:87-1424(-)